MSKRISISNGIVAGTDSVTRYLADTARITRLTAAEEADLMLAAKQGDRHAINRILESNLRFVAQVARKFLGQGLPMEDLIAFGNEGLIAAINRFDPTRGVKFITAAVWSIRGTIQQACEEYGSVIRVPHHNAPTTTTTVKSISDPVGDDENRETWADRYLAADEVKSAQEHKDLRFDLQRALMQLKPKEREAITRYYGLGYDYPQPADQIAVQLGCTQNRVYQLVDNGMSTLRTTAPKLLAQYL
jgi:RNA polymerase primary sigma factor